MTENPHNSVVELGFELTQKCNLACSYCYLGNRNNAALDMTNEIADKAIDLLFKNIKAGSVIGVTFWGGEPLLNFKLIKYITEQCKVRGKKDNIKISFQVITNGTILNDEMLCYFDKEKIMLQISLDGDEVIHDHYRKTKTGKGSYQKIISNIKKIDNYNKEYGHCGYSIKTTITKQSLPVKRILEHFNEMGFVYNIAPATSSPHFDDEKTIDPSEIEKEAKALFDDWELQFTEKGTFKNHLVTEFFKTIILNKKRRYACLAGLSYYGVGADGKIYPCHRLFNNPDLVVGDVWNGINTELSKSLFNHTIDQRELCNKCALLFICGSTCPVDSVMKGNFNEIDPVFCAFNKIIIKECLTFLLKTKRTNPKQYQELLNMLNEGKTKLEESTVEFPFMEINFEPEMLPGFQDKIPIKKENVKVIDLEEDGVLYIEGEVEKKYIANLTIMAIWDLIDGVKTNKEIACYIADLCKVDLDKIDKDIYKQIAILKELRLIDA